jgi:hypothetical protein
VAVACKTLAYIGEAIREIKKIHFCQVQQDDLKFHSLDFNIAKADM